MKLTFYPGCSAHATARPYDESFRAISRALGVELVEIDDWNCCGAMASQSIDRAKALVIASRNIGLAEKLGNDIVAHCSSCYVVLRKVMKAWQTEPETKALIDGALAEIGLSISGKLKVMHAYEFYTNENMLELIKSKIKKPLRGLKVASYYGCLAVRPFTDIDDPENPMRLDNLVEALGGEAVPYAMKTKCCGGALIAVEEAASQEQFSKHLECARQEGADCIQACCPMCLLSVDTYQGRVNKNLGRDYNIPAFYFTELIGLALGLDPAELGLKRHFVSNEALIASLA